jgi:Methyl coenzyme M reductase, gamma subunit
MAEKPKSEYVPNIYPGKDVVSERRKKLWDKSRPLLKYRSIAEDDITQILSHRAVRAAYVSVHPPLEEMIEPYDPIKYIVVPTPGTRAGDRIRFIQMSDSFHLPSIAPFGRQRLYFSRFRGWIPLFIVGGRYWR